MRIVFLAEEYCKKIIRYLVGEFGFRVVILVWVYGRRVILIYI